MIDVILHICKYVMLFIDLKPQLGKPGIQYQLKVILRYTLRYSFENIYFIFVLDRFFVYFYRIGGIMWVVDLFCTDK